MFPNDIIAAAWLAIFCLPLIIAAMPLAQFIRELIKGD